MTPRERAIVEIYTGICMATGEQRSEVYKYMNEIMDRPVFTHELASKEVQKQLKEKSKEDFINLCREPQTWGNKIRSMSDEELAEFLIKGKFNCSNVFDCSDVCKDFKKGCAWGCKHKDGNDMEVLSEWLKSEAKE